MKKILLIARTTTAAATQKAATFAGANRDLLAADDVQVEHCEISELFFELGRDKMAIYHPTKKFDLSQFDLVVMRHVGQLWAEAHAITLYCEHLGIQYADTYLNRPLPGNKLSTAFLLWTQEVRQLPYTMYGPTEELVRRLPDLGQTAVLKDSEGRKGRLNFMVSSADDIRRIAQEHPNKRFVLQQFIPSDGDLRVLVMNGQVSLAIRRFGDGLSHLNNTSQGSKAELVLQEQIDSQVVQACIQSAAVVKLQVAGVDIMYDAQTSDYYVLEVNNGPQISSGWFKQEKSVAYAEMIGSLLDTGKTAKNKLTIGQSEHVQLPTLGDTMMWARIDTGARSSSIWATTIRETPTGLAVRFASPEHEAYQQEQIFEHYDKVNVSSSMGHEQKRYKIKLPVIIKGRRIKASFTLADRSSQTFPILIGRSTLYGKFIVDVTAEHDGSNQSEVLPNKADVESV